GLEVVKVDEVGVFEVQAVADAAELGVGAAADEELERNFFAAVGDGEVHLAKPALAEAPLDGEAVERALAPSVGELHGPPLGRGRWTKRHSLAAQWDFNNRTSGPGFPALRGRGFSGRHRDWAQVEQGWEDGSCLAASGPLASATRQAGRLRLRQAAQFFGAGGSISSASFFRSSSRLWIAAVRKRMSCSFLA